MERRRRAQTARAIVRGLGRDRRGDGRGTQAAVLDPVRVTPTRCPDLSGRRPAPASGPGGCERPATPDHANMRPGREAHARSDAGLGRARRATASWGRCNSAMSMNAVYHGPADLPHTIPVFPLPGALLLPRGQMPLNIFEPRYLEMVDDSLRDGHR